MPVFASVGAYLHGFISDLLPGNGLPDAIINRDRRLMTEEQEREILSRYEKAAEAGREVTAQEIKAAFDEALGRDTGNSYIYVLLKRHNWRKV